MGTVILWYIVNLWGLFGFVGQCYFEGTVILCGNCYFVGTVLLYVDCVTLWELCCFVKTLLLLGTAQPCKNYIILRGNFFL